MGKLFLHDFGELGMIIVIVTNDTCCKYMYVHHMHNRDTHTVHFYYSQAEHGTVMLANTLISGSDRVGCTLLL